MQSAIYFIHNHTSFFFFYRLTILFYCFSSICFIIKISVEWDLKWTMLSNWSEWSEIIIKLKISYCLHVELRRTVGSHNYFMILFLCSSTYWISILFDLGCGNLLVKNFVNGLIKLNADWVFIMWKITMLCFKKVDFWSCFKC